MNLALIVEVLNSHGRGIERSSAQILTELRARGHQIEVLTAQVMPHHDSDGYVIREFDDVNHPGGGSWGQLKFAQRVKRIGVSGCPVSHEAVNRPDTETGISSDTVMRQIR